MCAGQDGGIFHSAGALSHRASGQYFRQWRSSQSIDCLQRHWGGLRISSSVAGWKGPGRGLPQVREGCVVNVWIHIVFFSVIWVFEMKMGKMQNASNIACPFFVPPLSLLHSLSLSLSLSTLPSLSLPSLHFSFALSHSHTLPPFPLSLSHSLFLSPPHSLHSPLCLCFSSFLPLSSLFLLCCHLLPSPTPSVIHPPPPRFCFFPVCLPVSHLTPCVPFSVTVSLSPVFSSPPLSLSLSLSSPPPFLPLSAFLIPSFPLFFCLSHSHTPSFCLSHSLTLSALSLLLSVFLTHSLPLSAFLIHSLFLPFSLSYSFLPFLLAPSFCLSYSLTPSLFLPFSLTHSLPLSAFLTRSLFLPLFSPCLLSGFLLLLVSLLSLLTPPPPPPPVHLRLPLLLLTMDATKCALFPRFLTLLGTASFTTVCTTVAWRWRFRRTCGAIGFFTFWTSARHDAAWVSLCKMRKVGVGAGMHILHAAYGCDPLWSRSYENVGNGRDCSVSVECLTV